MKSDKKPDSDEKSSKSTDESLTEIKDLSPEEIAEREHYSPEKVKDLKKYFGAIPFKPMMDAFSNEEIVEFRKIIDNSLCGNFATVSYIENVQPKTYNKDIKMYDFFPEVSRHDAIINSVLALKIIFDLSDKKKREFDSTHREYLKRYGQSDRHIMADQYRTLSHSERKQMSKWREENEIILLSEVLTLCILNHKLVRYYLISNPEKLSTIFSLMTEKNQNDIKTYCPGLYATYKKDASLSGKTTIRAFSKR